MLFGRATTKDAFFPRIESNKSAVVTIVIILFFSSTPFTSILSMMLLFSKNIFIKSPETRFDGITVHSMG